MSAFEGDALRALATQLREEGTPISDHVIDPSYAQAYDSPVLDAVREGYLLHYEESRLLTGHDADLALLAGDYLYALGLERLAAAGDCAAVLRLADLIAGCARLHAEGRGQEAGELWRAAVAASGDDAAPSQ